MSSPAKAADQESIANNLLSRDPFLYDVQLYDDFRRKNCVRLSEQFSETLSRAAALEPSIIPFCQYLTQLLQELETANEKVEVIDPHFSTFFRLWIGGLETGLDWISTGVNPSFLTYFADLNALKEDLRSEYQLLSESGTLPTRIVDETIRLIPVSEVAFGPRFSSRVQDCLPGFPDASLYKPMDEESLDALQEHITVSLNHIKELDEAAYQGFKRNIHTIHVSLIRSAKKSLGSRCDCPGSLIAAFPEGRLRQGDTYSTASQLYHEHCHTKLSLYCQVLEPPFSPEEVYISSFKNENRDMESILHTIYPITMECAIALALLPFYQDEAKQRAIAYLAAVGYRLQLVAEIFGADSLATSSPDFEGIKDLAKDVLYMIEQQVQSCPAKFRRAHDRERKRILERHAWDIGQFLCRGLAVRDPGLTEVTSTAGHSMFTFQGKRYSISLEPGQYSRGDYGYHVESLF